MLRSLPHYSVVKTVRELLFLYLVLVTNRAIKYISSGHDCMVPRNWKSYLVETTISVPHSPQVH
uniref:Uncharacterized protein n=1 Tax=Arion vulgaris TaxID=1028688 RepID=A0A0B7BN62_9EUPU